MRALHRSLDSAWGEILDGTLAATVDGSEVSPNSKRTPERLRISPVQPADSQPASKYAHPD